jgi:hypothetical protein
MSFMVVKMINGKTSMHLLRALFGSGGSGWNYDPSGLLAQRLQTHVLI